MTQYRLITVAGGYGARELTPRWASVASVKVAPRAACTIIAWRQLSLSWGPTVSPAITRRSPDKGSTS